MSFKINPEFDNPINKKELSNLVKEASELYGKKSNKKNSVGKYKLLKILDSVIYYKIMKISNLKEECDKYQIETVYHGTDDTLILSYLLELINSDMDNNSDNLIIIINKGIESYQKKPKKIIEHYFPLMMRCGLNSEQKSKINILFKKNFNLNIKSMPQWSIKKIKSKNLIRYLNRSTIFYGKDHSRSWRFSHKYFMEKKLKALCGSLIFTKLYHRESIIYNIFDDYSMVKNLYDDITIIQGHNRKIYYPIHNSISTFDEMIRKVLDCNPIPIDLNETLYINYISLMKTIHLCDKELRNIIYDSFRLYYEASIEKDYNMSFLKFWIIIEKVVKNKNALPDKDFLKIVKSYINKKYRTLVDDLYDKRNNIVHKNETDFITQSDRNMSKFIAEDVMILAIAPIIPIKTIDEFNYFIINYHKKSRRLKVEQKLSKKILMNRLS